MPKLTPSKRPHHPTFNPVTDQSIPSSSTRSDLFSNLRSRRPSPMIVHACAKRCSPETSPTFDPNPLQGVLEAIIISCAGYPTKRTFDEFINRFGMLAPDLIDRLGKQRCSSELVRWLSWSSKNRNLGKCCETNVSRGRFEHI